MLLLPWLRIVAKLVVSAQQLRNKSIAEHFINMGYKNTPWHRLRLHSPGMTDDRARAIEYKSEIPYHRLSTIYKDDDGWYAVQVDPTEVDKFRVEVCVRCFCLLTSPRATQQGRLAHRTVASNCNRIPPHWCTLHRRIVSILYGLAQYVVSFYP